MRLRFATAIFCCLCLGGALSACGGSSSSSSSATDNGVSAKAPNDIVTSAAQAVKGVTSIHVAGSTTSNNSPVSLDLHLVAGKGGRGTLSFQGQSLQIVAIGQTVYINAPASFWSKFANAQAAALLHDKWLKAPAGGQFSPFASLTNVADLFNQLLSQHGTLSKGSATTVDGQKTIGVVDTSKGGTLYVATTGKPYPVELVKGASKVVFDQVNQPVSLSAPANAISVPGQ
jgi:hypothetical protein